jgi:hypothetical protein
LANKLRLIPLMVFVALEQVAIGSSPKTLDHLGELVTCRHHDNRCGRGEIFNEPGAFNAGEAGHPKVHQDDLGLGLSQFVERDFGFGVVAQLRVSP